MTAESASMDSDEEKKCIEAFSRRVIKDKSGNYPVLKRNLDGSSIYPGSLGISSNRGKKLLQGSELVSREKMNNTRPLQEERIYYNGSEHNLLQRRKRLKFDNKYQDTGDDVNLSKLVDVRKILTPISSLTDVSTNAVISRPFTSSALREQALKVILMIEKEKLSVNAYIKLLEIFLGDYPEALYEDVLNLEKYDHNLSLDEDINGVNEQEHAETSENMSKNGNSNELVQKDTEEQQAYFQEHNNDDTEGKDGNNDNDERTNKEDPFFVVPKPEFSGTLLSLFTNTSTSEVSEEVETARQLAQIALQRNQEFVRNLQKVRMFLVKAERIKERIHDWSKELSGIQEEGVTIPSALRVVKRGLISATTNRSMLERQDEDDIEEDEDAV